MSRSSSDSAPPGDIIDLDRFMRTARPSSQRAGRRSLVVDNGKSATRSCKPSDSTGSSEEHRVQRDKRFSHDSGLSDGSYAPRRHRRRANCIENANRRKELQPKGSTDSLRAFRSVCERALLDQQQQIARVAQLCERLTEKRPSTDTSEISSSSRSTPDPKRKDKYRGDECKTYKIIMTKLDELNRLFAARNRSPPQRRRPSITPSGSVSVSDKVVATEPTVTSPKNTVTTTVVTARRMDALVARANCNPSEDRARRLAVLRAVTNGPALDIAPAKKTRESPNIHTESMVNQDYSDITSVSCDHQCDFDLENPVHLYAQAKRLQAMHATTCRRIEASSCRRARSVDSSRGGTLCALCRGYFRTIRQYLATQLLCCPS